MHLLQGLLALTDDQLRDLMLMRQLYLTKRGLLAMERKALVNQMGSNEGSMPHPSDNITKMADLATCLKENAAEDHHVHRKVARAVYRGVRPLRSVHVCMLAVTTCVCFCCVSLIVLLKMCFLMSAAACCLLELRKACTSMQVS